MMMSTPARGSAKIYAFPTPSRIAAVGRREAARMAEAVAPSAAPVIVTGGAWYHDEAIRDAQPSGKR